jgi:hypothetical protein
MRNEILINAKLLTEFPGPLVKETTSKAQVIQFCQKNVKDCLSNSNVNLIDPQSHALLWDFLALLVRQNGIFDLKTDISPLLLNGIADANAQQQQQTQQSNLLPPPKSSNNPTTIKQSASSSSLIQQQQDFVLVNNEDPAIATSTASIVTQLNEATAKSTPAVVAQQQQGNEVDAHLNKLRQLLGAGQKSDAIDYAIKNNMWPHAFFLASSFNNTSMSNTATISLTASSANIAAGSTGGQQTSELKFLQKVKFRFINSLQPNDPILTCYQLLMGKVPSVANVWFTFIHPYLTQILLYSFKIDLNKKNIKECLKRSRMERLETSFGNDCFKC